MTSNVTRLDKTLSEAYASLITVKPHNCYGDAFNIWSYVLSDYPSARYCEGYATHPDGIPLEHGWIEIELSGIEKKVAVDVSWGTKYNAIVYRAVISVSMSEFLDLRPNNGRRGMTLPIMEFHNQAIRETQPDNEWFQMPPKDDPMFAINRMMNVFNALNEALRGNDE